MFDPKTVFILGAGASWHYGYPTGQALVKKVITKAKVAERYFTQARIGSPLRPQYIARNSSDPPAGGTFGLKKEWEASRIPSFFVGLRLA
jgi:hypothetical protein